MKPDLVTNFLAGAASNAAGMSRKISAFSLKEIERFSKEMRNRAVWGF